MHTLSLIQWRTLDERRQLATMQRAQLAEAIDDIKKHLIQWAKKDLKETLWS